MTDHDALSPIQSNVGAAGAGAAALGYASERRILAVVLPQLLCELTQHLHARPFPTRPFPTNQGPSPSSPRAPLARRERAIQKGRADLPRAIVLVDALTGELDGRTELDAVNAAAHRQGVRPRQMLAHARASVEGLVVLPLLRSKLQAALAHLAEMLLRFGSPVSFRAPDTLWVDITGSSHLHASEQDLALEVLAQIKTMGHAARAAVAPGPWLARAFAQHLPLGPMGTQHVAQAQAARHVGQLPIIALPIQQEAVTWFARLGLLNIENLKKLPTSSLATRLAGQVTEGTAGSVLELLQGRDDGILIPHQPEEAPVEELFWEDPLEASEPLLFILKGLAGRLSARLEGRGQAAHELRLTLHYDRSIAALATAEGQATAHSKSLSFKLATPLFHADDLERVMRLRLQRQELLAPTVGLSLQASAVTEAHHSQLALAETPEWSCGISTDARALTVLLAELSADIGGEAVGRLISLDSHLLEKSCWLQPISANDSSNVNTHAAEHEQLRPHPTAPAHELGGHAPLQPQLPSERADDSPVESADTCLPQLPTRLIHPAIEIHAPIRKSELWVIGERAYVVQDIRFEQRLEDIEWWECNRVFRDYFRVWLVCASARNASPLARASSGHRQNVPDDAGGMEALVYRDRERGKSYLHALFD